MTYNQVRVAAFCVYLIAWLILAIAAVVGAIPRRDRQAAISPSTAISARAPGWQLIGMLLQCGAALVITLTMSTGPLRPGVLQLTGALALAPFAAALFIWALRSAPKKATSAREEMLATEGAYAWLRHPIYLAFLAMLVATALLVSSALQLLASVSLYLAGSELRIAAEELDLAEKFPSSYVQYRLRTRWRYLPGIR